MLFINGKRATEEEIEKYLSSYDKIATITLSNAGKGRHSTNHGFVKSQSRVNLPMKYSINDPTKKGMSLSIVYTAVDDFETDDHGTLKKGYEPKMFTLTQSITLLKANENSELLVALALHPYNSANYLYDGAPNVGTSAPAFTMAKKGKIAVASTTKDELMLTALGHVVGESKINDNKAIQIYKILGLDPIHLENEDIKSIRAELSTYAKNSPERLIAAVTDTLGDMKAKITTAFERGILVASDVRKVTWGLMVTDRDPKATICMYPIGADKVNHFADFLVKKDLDGSVRDKLLQELEAVSS